MQKTFPDRATEPVKIEDEEGGYLGMLDVVHQLHCLVSSYLPDSYRFPFVSGVQKGQDDGLFYLFQLGIHPVKLTS